MFVLLVVQLKYLHSQYVLWKSFNHCLLAQQKRCNNNLNYNAFCNLDDTMGVSCTDSIINYITVSIICAVSS